MTYPFRRDKAAFTLIELSIVLVIVALIAAGVLVGKDMIEASRINRQIAQIENFKTAITTFKLKYDCLPGDCARAEQLGLGAAGAAGSNGDGNSIIRNYNIEFGWAWFIQQERLNLWYHLMRAGVIEGTYRGYDMAVAPTTDTELAGLNPQPVIGKGMDNAEANVPVVTACVASFSSAGLGNCLALVTISPASYGYTLTSTEAWRIDSKMDDGLPVTGKVRIIHGYSSIYLSDGTTTGCNGNGTNEYDISGNWNVYTFMADTGNPERVECGVAFFGGF